MRAPPLLGSPLPLTFRAGAADVSFTEGLVDMALDGIGLMGDGGHTVREAADLTTLPSQTRRLAVTLLRLGERQR